MPTWPVTSTTRCVLRPAQPDDYTALAARYRAMCSRTSPRRIGAARFPCPAGSRSFGPRLRAHRDRRRAAEAEGGDPARPAAGRRASRPGHVVSNCRESRWNPLHLRVRAVCLELLRVFINSVAFAFGLSLATGNALVRSPAIRNAPTTAGASVRSATNIGPPWLIPRLISRRWKQRSPH